MGASLTYVLYHCLTSCMRSYTFLIVDYFSDEDEWPSLIKSLCRRPPKAGIVGPERERKRWSFSMWWA